MLEYRLNNIPLIIDNSTSFVLVNRNPACFTDTLQNCAALGVDIPANEHNRAYLDNPERFEKYRQPEERKYTGFEIRWDGALLIAGSLIVEFDGTGYNGWVQSTLGALGEDQQEKFINEMDWPTAQTLSVKESYSDTDDDYSLLQLHNRLFWEGKGKEEEKTVAYQSITGTEYKLETRTLLGHSFHSNYNDIINNFDTGDIKEGCVISPFLHLRYVIKESLRLNQFYINRNDMLTDFMVKNHTVYHNFNIVSINFNTTPQTKPVWNYRDDSQEDHDFEEIEEKVWSVGTFNYADLLPKTKYKPFLVGLQNSINYIFYFRTDGKVDIIDRNATPNTTAIDIEDYFRGQWKIGKQYNLRLKFMPEYDGDDAKFGEEFEDLSDRDTDFGAPVADMDELNALSDPAFGELRLVEKTNEIYEYGWNVVTSEDATHIEQQFDSIGWNFVSIGNQPYVYGTGEEEEEIETAISTTQRIKSPDFFDLFTIPVVEQKGNIDKMRSAWNDYTLRLLPQNQILSADSLIWDGAFGLFKERWEDWARFWKSRLEVTANFQLPINMVSHIQNNITNKFRTQKGEFIIEEMTTEFGMHQIGETTIKGFKI